jgi:hypothetical protein
MPRRIRHHAQPQIAPSAGDLGREAYQANLADQPGPDLSADGDQAGTVPVWRHAEPKNTQHGEHRNDAQARKLGQD